MTTEVESVPAQEDLAAGFNEVFGSSVPVETPAAEPEVPTATTETPEATPEPVEERFAGYTKAELDTAISRLNAVEELKDQVRKATGQSGRLQQQLDLLKAAKANPSVSDAKLERMVKFISDNFPDAFEGVETTPVPPEPPKAAETLPETNNTDVEQEVERKAQQKAIDDLNEAHPDRAVIRATPEYAQWLKSLLADEKAKFEASWSPIYVSKMLDNFKEWDKKRLASAKRLESAVPPTTGKARTTLAIPDFESSVKQGFDSVFS